MSKRIWIMIMLLLALSGSTMAQDATAEATADPYATMPQIKAMKDEVTVTNFAFQEVDQGGHLYCQLTSFVEGITNEILFPVEVQVGASHNDQYLVQKTFQVNQAPKSGKLIFRLNVVSAYCEKIDELSIHFQWEAEGSGFGTFMEQKYADDSQNLVVKSDKDSAKFLLAGNKMTYTLPRDEGSSIKIFAFNTDWDKTLLSGFQKEDFFSETLASWQELFDLKIQLDSQDKAPAQIYVLVTKANKNVMLAQRIQTTSELGS